MSELGDSADNFRSGVAASGGRVGPTGPKRTVAAPSESAGWGRGPAAVDGRKFKFDIIRAKTQPALPFTVSKLDRLDADKAGELLIRVMRAFGIEREDETRMYGFMSALFFQHTLNGASILQPGRGMLKVDGVEFDLSIAGTVLGIEARRFFRAFSDEISDVNQRIIEDVDPMDPVSMEMYGQLMQVAQERGLQKYPKFAHDSADACIHMSLEERRAVMVSKRLVLLSTVNRADETSTSDDARDQREAQST